MLLDRVGGVGFDAAWLRPGSHVNGIGAFRLDMVELPPELIALASVMAVDARQAALAEAGDVVSAIAAGHIAESEVIEIGSVSREWLAHRDPHDVTAFKSVGLAIPGRSYRRAGHHAPVRCRRSGVRCRRRGEFDLSWIALRYRGYDSRAKWVDALPEILLAPADADEASAPGYIAGGKQGSPRVAWIASAKWRTVLPATGCEL